MRLLLLVFAALAFSACLSVAEYTIGDDYNLDRGPSPWDGTGAERTTFEYRLLYLLQADKELKDLWYCHPAGLSERQSLQLGRAVDNLDEVLVHTYGQATRLFQSHSNPRLLKMMLSHYYLYVNSANEIWQPVINDLSKVDEKLASAVSKEAKPRWMKADDTKQP